MLYGRPHSHEELDELYEKGEIVEVGENWYPIELKQLSLEMPATDLRLLAKFLNDMAEKLENGTFKTDHVHIDEVSKEWVQRNPDVDIVICDPDFDWDSVPRVE